MNIIPVIRDLLLRNRKAVVPGFGSFLMTQKPAQLNKVTQVLTPPSVTVKFDNRKQDDDGQLTGFLSRKFKLNAAKSRILVEDFRTEIVEKLERQGSVSLEGLGTLTGHAGDVVFVPEEELLKRISLFEMPGVDIPRPVQAPGTVQENPPRPVQEKVPPRPVEIPVSVASSSHEPLVAEYSHKRRWIFPIVLLGLLLGMLFLIYLSGNMELLVNDIKSAVTGKKDSAHEETTEQLVFGKTDDEQSIADTGTAGEINRELENKVSREKALSYEHRNQDASNPVTSSAVTQPETRTTEANLPDGHTYAKPYHVIAGSFTILANAEKQRSTLQAKGLQAEILPRKGNFYMVSLGSFDTPSQASDAMKLIQENLKYELWVMRNR